MKKFWMIVALSLIMWAETASAALVASVDRKLIPQGETVILTLKYDGGKTNQQPDFMPLQKDFSIFSTGTAFQHNFINGKTTQSQEWQLMLMPRGIGKITIPSLALGKLRSNPVEIEVVEANSPTANKAAKASGQAGQPRLAIEAKVDNTNPYVQQEVNVAVKLFDYGGMQIENIIPLDANENNWTVHSLGEPELDSEVINGETVRVITLRFALFPQKSGVLKLPEFMARGYYLTRKARDPMRQIFDDAFGGMEIGGGFDDIFATKQPVSVTSKPIEITVKPMPDGQRSAWWIPAESVELYSEWKPTPPQFKVGEAVTRNIYIKAVGVTDNQLPNPDFKDSDALRQYPEKPVAEMKIEDGKIASYKMISTVYIPSKQGKTIVPEVSVNWFNVKTGKGETTTLPAMEINVLPNANIRDTVAVEPEAPAKPEAPQQAGTTQSIADVEPEYAAPWYVKYIWVIAAFAAGCVISWIIIRRQRPQNDADEILPAKDYAKRVRAAAKANDVKELRDSLIYWCRQNYQRDDITNLRDVAQAVGYPEFAKLLEELSARLYNPQAAQWNAQAFMNCFDKVVSKKYSSTKGSGKPLPDLYD